MNTWENFIDFIKNTDFEDEPTIVMDPIPSTRITTPISKEEALNFFAQAAAIAIEKDYMCDGLEALVWPYIADENDSEYEEKVYNEIWEDLIARFKEIFGCEYYECY